MTSKPSASSISTQAAEQPAFMPGPWIVCDDPTYPNRDGQLCIIAEGGWGLGVALTTIGGPIETTRANANLIAAAPDVYEALVNARNQLMWIINYDSEDKVLAKAIDRANAALAKARGETANVLKNEKHGALTSEPQASE